MQSPLLRALLVDDEPVIAKFVEEALSVDIPTPFELRHVGKLSDAFAHLGANTFDVLLLNLGLPGYRGLEALKAARGRNQEIAIVVLTDQNDAKTALAALEQGAQDYLVKSGLTPETLCRAIRHSIQRQLLVSVTVERNRALETRDKLAAIVEFSEDAIISETFDGQIVSWNQAAQQMYGYTAAEVHGRNISFLLPKEPDSSLNQIRAAVRRGEPCRNFDTYFIAKDGRRIEISLSVSPIKDKQGKVIGISKIGRDISERKRVERALRTSEERLELAFRGSSDGLVEWNLSTNEAYWSPRTREILGFKVDAADEFENRFEAISSRMHPDDRKSALDEISQAVRCREAVRSEFRLRDRQGDYRWLHLRGRAVYDTSGAPCHFAGALTDITDRKQLEAELTQRDEQLRQSHKLEAVGSLAGGIAHEFNNLLQAIRGYTTYAMEGLSPDNQRHQDLEQVVKAADRATTLTRALLGFSRQHVLEQTNVDSRELVTDLVKLLRPLIGEHIELILSLATNAGLIRGDQGLLQQMLLNLCINARDAMPTGGRLILKTQRVDLSDKYCKFHPVAKPGPYVMFSVADTGSGIPPEVKDRIFEPFFTTKDVGKGTGLGLAMVHGCVRQHGGTITVYSEPGLGTTFKIYLPIVAKHDAFIAPIAPVDVAGGKETILVAEDEPMVRDLALRILTRAGYTVLVASDGAEAVELLETNLENVSLALLDAIMPKMTGHQVHDRIKLMNPELPVIFCSGYDPETSQISLLGSAGVRMVQKPYDPDVLLRAIREALDTRRVREELPCGA